MQETRFKGFDEEMPKTMKEFFGGKTDDEVEKKMDHRLEELKTQGHTLVRRIKIGRNAKCPCESGKKFKKCCIDKTI